MATAWQTATCTDNRATNGGILSDWPVDLDAEGQIKGESMWQGVRAGTAETYRSVIQ